MSSLPSITGQDAIRAFEKRGFRVVRITGAHHIMKREGHRFLLSVPIHSGKCLKPGTLRGLLRAADLTVEEFVELLD
jgi:predicted RNA binding protein YcfA (HicA-like mRNA interferase family)